jgi:hypothetical protein
MVWIARYCVTRRCIPRSCCRCERGGCTCRAAVDVPDSWQCRQLRCRCACRHRDPFSVTIGFSTPQYRGHREAASHLGVIVSPCVFVRAVVPDLQGEILVPEVIISGGTTTRILHSSGWEISDARFAYDNITDTLYFGQCCG